MASHLSTTCPLALVGSSETRSWCAADDSDYLRSPMEAMAARMTAFVQSPVVAVAILGAAVWLELRSGREIRRHMRPHLASLALCAAAWMAHALYAKWSLMSPMMRTLSDSSSSSWVSLFYPTVSGSLVSLQGTRTVASGMKAVSFGPAAVFAAAGICTAMAAAAVHLWAMVAADRVPQPVSFRQKFAAGLQPTRRDCHNSGEDGSAGGVGYSRLHTLSSNGPQGMNDSGDVMRPQSADATMARSVQPLLPMSKLAIARRSKVAMGSVKVSGEEVNCVPNAEVCGVVEQNEEGLERNEGDPSDGGSPGGGLFWRAVVLGISAVLATNFPSIKMVLAQPDMTPPLMLATRFSVAALAMSPFLLQIENTAVLLGGIECGLWVTLAYATQAIGLLTTTAGHSAFICALRCVVVAAVVGIVNKKVEPRALVAAILAVMGVGLLEIGDGSPPVVGDFISLGMPIGLGMGYVKLEQLMKDFPSQSQPVTALKLVTVALSSIVLCYLPILGPDPTGFDIAPVLASPTALAGVLYTGIVTSAICVWLEARAFAEVPATDASVILATEPLFAAVLSFYAIGEELGSQDVMGGLLVILACLVSELGTPEGMQRVRELLDRGDNE